MIRLDWPGILDRAKAIVESYDTLVTLRQLFYRLVAAVLLPNTLVAYKTLSDRSAAARRAGWFPALEDRTRTIHRTPSFTSPADAERWLAEIYRRDRTEGQARTVYLGVEKHGLVNQLNTWFGGPFGLPIVPLGGYASQTLKDQVAEDATAGGRPAVLLYAGDFDPSGEDIVRDFVEQAGCFDEVVRIALSWDQVEAYGLPPQPGKATDSRAAGFVARHGRLVQVELDALDPNDLRDLYRRALDGYWDMSAYEAVLEREDEERAIVQNGGRPRPRGRRRG